MSQIEEEQRLEELRRAQAALLEKQEKNDKKKENEEFLDSLVMIKKCYFITFQVDILSEEVDAICTYFMALDLIYNGCPLVCLRWTKIFGLQIITTNTL